MKDISCFSCMIGEKLLPLLMLEGCRGNWKATKTLA